MYDGKRLQKKTEDGWACWCKAKNGILSHPLAEILKNTVLKLKKKKKKKKDATPLTKANTSLKAIVEKEGLIQGFQKSFDNLENKRKLI